MTRYLVFAKPPTTEELYADWSSKAVKWQLVNLSETDISASNDNLNPALMDEESYALSQIPLAPLAVFRARPSSLSLPPGTMNDLSYVNESSYVGAQTQQSVFVPEFPFEVSHLTPLRQCIQPNSMSAHHRSNIQLLGLVYKMNPLKHTQAKDKLLKPKLVLELHIMDLTGSLLITAWEEMAEKISRTLRIGDVVYLSCMSKQRLCIPPLCAQPRLLAVLLSTNSFHKRVVGTLSTKSTQFHLCWRTDRRGEEDDIHRPSLAFALSAGDPAALKIQAILSYAEQYNVLS